MAVEFPNLANGLSTTLGNELNTRLNALKAAANQVETEIAALDTDLNSATTTIAEHTTALATDDAAITSLETSVAGLQATDTDAVIPLALVLDLNAALGRFTGPTTAYVPAVTGNNVTKWEDQGPRLNHALKMAAVPETSTPITSAENDIAHLVTTDTTHGLVLSQALPFGPKTIYLVVNETTNQNILEWGFSGVVPGNLSIQSTFIYSHIRELPNPLRTLAKAANFNTWKILCIVIAATETGHVSSQQAWSTTPYQLGYGTNSYPGLFARRLSTAMDTGALPRIRRLLCYAGAHSRLTRNSIINNLSTQYNIPIEVQL
jgi:hypothetical protein